MHMEVNSMNWLSIRTPLRRSDVDSLEKELRIKLPDDYKEQMGLSITKEIFDAYYSSEE